MAAKETLTWDLEAADGGPSRPSLDDVGGGILEDDELDPPAYDGTMPYADMLNQVQKQIPALGKQAFSLKITIDYDAGDPFIARLVATGSNITAGDLTVTDLGDGDTQVTWPANTIPPTNADPVATVNELGDFNAVAVEVSNGVNVATFNGAGSLADLRVTVLVS